MFRLKEANCFPLLLMFVRVASIGLTDGLKKNLKESKSKSSRTAVSLKNSTVIMEKAESARSTLTVAKIDLSAVQKLLHKKKLKKRPGML